MTATPFRSAREEADPFRLLAARVPIRYSKGACIYSELRQPAHLHMIVRGRVMVTRAGFGRRIVIDVYGADEFFGECALTELDRLPEQAVALERTEAMRWTKKEIEELVISRPQLGVALVQALARRTIDFGARLESCLGEKTADRVLHSLIRFSARAAVADDAGCLHLPPITHRVLSQYVGTRREIVTQHMNLLRRRGVLDYSRKGIVLNASAFRAA